MHEHTLPFSFLDYLELLDWAGRHVHQKKAGYISTNTPSIFESLKIEVATWLDGVQNFGAHFGNFAGSQTILRAHAAKNDVNWYKGVG